MLNIWSVTVVILLVSELAPRAQADQDPTTPLNCTNMKILQGVCLPGSTYRSAAVNGTAAGCCAACAADGVKCVAWTIDTYRWVESPFWRVFFHTAPCHPRPMHRVSCCDVHLVRAIHVVLCVFDLRRARSIVLHAPCS